MEGQRFLSSTLTAAEYRLLADLLLNHIEAENLQDEQLENLANHLYRLAVQADRDTIRPH
jgi:hypothetical protein